MPITPFHLGPGVLLKSLLQGYFSLMVFGFTQVIMDIQPLLVIITGKGQLHGFTHSYVGASIIALLSMVVGKYLSDFVITKIHSQFIIAWKVAAISAFIGAYSHVLLDSIMHGDIEPWFPFSAVNRLLGVITMEELHLFCIASAFGGIVCHYLSQHRD